MTSEMTSSREAETGEQLLSGRCALCCFNKTFSCVNVENLTAPAHHKYSSVL